MTSISEGFRWLGLRRADLSSSCACVKDNRDGHRAPTRSCRRCLGTGHLFTDYLVKGYLWRSYFTGTEYASGPGRIATQGRNLILPHDQPAKKFDLVLVLDLDPETGEPRQPFRIVENHVIVDVFNVIGQNGRSEFYRCTLQERSIDDSRPGHEGTDILNVIDR